MRGVIRELTIKQIDSLFTFQSFIVPMLSENVDVIVGGETVNVDIQYNYAIQEVLAHMAPALRYTITPYENYLIVTFVHPISQTYDEAFPPRSSASHLSPASH